MRSKLTSLEIIETGRKLFDMLEECGLCPHECRVNRLEGEKGKCKTGSTARVASYNLHYGEEPPLSGGGGSGTIFLSNCSLSCQYCQNYPISQMGTGSDVEIEELRDMMLKLQKRGAENINFVTPDHMVPMIMLALGQAKEAGLNKPIVYNSSGYQKLEILKFLEGIIDIYLVDMRYNENRHAEKYSGCENYVEVNRAAVKEMYRQVGNLKVNDDHLAESGVIIRHLVLPHGISGSEGIFEFLADEVSENIFVSLMSQYFPAHKAGRDDKIYRRIKPEEFEKAVDAFYEAGLKNGYIQNLTYESTY